MFAPCCWGSRPKPAPPARRCLVSMVSIDLSHHERDLLALAAQLVADEHCGDEYLTKESTISYRPSALTLLDGSNDQNLWMSLGEAA